MLVVREKGLRTIPKTKVNAIAHWIDSGATTHVCKDRCWYKTYEPVEDGSVLYMGDDHFAYVHRKGSVVLEFSSGKSITLFNVLYVPKLRFGYYNNGMFMLNLNKVPDDSDSVYTSSSAVVNSSLWHARIIHETTSPYTPQQNGVAERKNRPLKEMVNSMLSYEFSADNSCEEREIKFGSHNTHIANSIEEDP
ncbi:zinc finger, CCHC-type containing protein [Tanacetum coccineum]